MVPTLRSEYFLVQSKMPSTDRNHNQHLVNFSTSTQLPDDPFINYNQAFTTPSSSYHAPYIIHNSCKNDIEFDGSQNDGFFIPRIQQYQRMIFATFVLQVKDRKIHTVVHDSMSLSSAVVHFEVLLAVCNSTHTQKNSI